MARTFRKEGQALYRVESSSIFRADVQPPTAVLAENDMLGPFVEPNMAVPAGGPVGLQLAAAV
jgi:hypothetical protein